MRYQTRDESCLCTRHELSVPTNSSNTVSPGNDETCGCPVSQCRIAIYCVVRAREPVCASEEGVVVHRGTPITVLRARAKREIATKQKTNTVPQAYRACIRIPIRV
jgi:hypothetical protein